jgi:hypothetical protein
VILTLFLFADSLFDPSKIVAAKSTDLALQFLPWRKFGFDQLRAGNLALWNPHIFGGAPYFAGFQSALLYPPNWLHLFMPVGLAISWINALHVFLAGYFTFLWCRHRKLSRPASFLAGAMFMYCGPYFPHVYAGHLPHIAIMVWAPLLFLAIDLVMDGVLLGGSLLGIFATAMFLLAGHPQYVYYTGMAAAVYVIANIWLAKKPGMFAVGCAIIAVGGIALASVQLLSGMDAVKESVRSGGTKYEFSASFSFPPENLLTTIAPNVFGRLPTLPGETQPETYFGRCYLWEVSLFVSVTGLILAIYGAVATPLREKRGAALMVVVCFILALGAHTPLHHFLYDHLPGFAGFRGSVKFNYLVALFLALLAAFGFDTLMKDGKARFGLLGVALVLLIFTIVLASVIQSSAHEGIKGWWAHAMRRTLETATEVGDMFWDPKPLGNPKFIERAGEIAASALFAGAFVIGGSIVILLVTFFRPSTAYALIILAVVEMTWFACSTRATMPSQPDVPKAWVDAAKQAPAGARVLDASTERANMGMWFGYNDVWGYDPGVPKRYAELIAVSQGVAPDQASQYAQFRQLNPRVFALLRCALILKPDPKDPIVKKLDAMPIAQLVSTAIPIQKRDDILHTIISDRFDPQRVVLLESEPIIKPSGTASPGEVRIVKQSTDWIELEINATANAILLITNNYSAGWHVESLGSSSQASYQVMPADWSFQGIPIIAGSHHIRVVYRPTAFVVGAWLTVLSVFGYLAALTWFVNVKIRQRRSTATAPAAAVA